MGGNIPQGVGFYEVDTRYFELQALVDDADVAHVIGASRSLELFLLKGDAERTLFCQNALKSSGFG